MFSYILYGLDRATAVSEGLPDAVDILETFSKLDHLKRSEDEKAIAELIPQFNSDCSSRVPSFFHKSSLVSITQTYLHFIFFSLTCLLTPIKRS